MKTFLLVLSLQLWVQPLCLGLDICDNVIVPPALCAKEGQKQCPKEKDAFGCDTGNFCYPTHTNNECPLNCPPVCSKDEIFCFGTTNDRNCPTNHTCIPKTDPTTGCPNYCKPQCNAGYRICPGIRRNCKGKSEPCCTPASHCVSKDEECQNQIFNEDGCPILPEDADARKCYADTEMPCIHGNDEFGCPRPMYCHKVSNEQAGCTPHCPAACNLWYELSCPKTYDLNGCQEKPTCSRYQAQCPENKHIKITGCPTTKSIKTCTDGHTLCPFAPVTKQQLAPEGFILLQGEGERACHLPGGTCKPIEDTNEKSDTFGCPLHCPEHCTKVCIN